MNNSDTTKPCPFCGQLPDVTDEDFFYPLFRSESEFHVLWRAGCIESAGGCGAEVTGPVSYTHLDVYKRQVLEAVSLRLHTLVSIPCLLYTSRCV